MQDPNSIVLSMDMHLAIPPGFVNYARKVRISMQVWFVHAVCEWFLICEQIQKRAIDQLC